MWGLKARDIIRGKDTVSGERKWSSKVISTILSMGKMNGTFISGSTGPPNIATVNNGSVQLIVPVRDENEPASTSHHMDPGI